MPNLFKMIYKSLKVDDKNEELLEVPKRDVPRLAPKQEAYIKDAEHQADLLYLPTDNGYRYALVVVDVATRLADAEPLKTKKSDEVLRAIKRIWKRKPLNRPTIFLKVDNGGEFKKSFDQYFKSNGIIIKRGLPNRHRQQGLVEWLNYIIGRSIFAFQNQKEDQTKEENTEWVKNLSKIISEYNKYIKGKKLNPERLKKLKPKFDDGPILEVGTLARRQLDYPEDIKGKKISGKFRATDKRWEEKPRKIVDVFISPGQPVLYRLQGIQGASYTKNQLQLVK